MKNIRSYRLIYKTVLDVLDKNSADKKTLILAVLKAFSLSDNEIRESETNSRSNTIKANAATVINRMLSRRVIDCDENGLYKINTERPIAIRIERCEEEILKLLRSAPHTKASIREKLVKIMRTDKTTTTKDDNQLLTYIGQLLKRLVAEQILVYDGSLYKIAKVKTAEARNRQELMALQADFILTIHERGGEFFEHYFMNLIERYVTKRCAKTVLENLTVGGSNDGGIDGILKTVDRLGFKETVLVQTKNRNEHSTEVDIRSFYGSVCANQGTRGIFATTSNFHVQAQSFLDTLDNCIGINGSDIFNMACDVGYGIKKSNGRLYIDKNVI